MTRSALSPRYKHLYGRLHQSLLDFTRFACDVDVVRSGGGGGGTSDRCVTDCGVWFPIERVSVPLHTRYHVLATRQTVSQSSHRSHYRHCMTRRLTPPSRAMLCCVVLIGSLLRVAGGLCSVLCHVHSYHRYGVWGVGVHHVCARVLHSACGFVPTPPPATHSLSLTGLWCWMCVAQPFISTSFPARF
jgi:hypothetical protein